MGSYCSCFSCCAFFLLLSFFFSVFSGFFFFLLDSSFFVFFRLLHCLFFLVFFVGVFSSPFLLLSLRKGAYRRQHRFFVPVFRICFGGRPRFLKFEPWLGPEPTKVRGEIERDCVEGCCVKLSDGDGDEISSTSIGSAGERGGMAIGEVC